MGEFKTSEPNFLQLLGLGQRGVDPGSLRPPGDDPDIRTPGPGDHTQGPHHLGHQGEEHGPGPGHRLAAQHRGGEAHVLVR